ncbi:MAG: regulatory protein RecX [Gammaproteobacteria bacterium]
MDLLARREHSRAELRQKLLQRDFDAQEVEDALDGLEADRLLDDARFAESYVHYRRGRGFGPLRIRQELQQRGVGSELIGAYLPARPREWLDDARREYEKKFGSVKVDDFKERARRARFLQGRGFPGEVIRMVLDWDE